MAGAYYWHRFYSHQPDLNFDNPEVRETMLEVVDFWLGMGVDGLRLDAVPYLFEREGTSCENLPETHAFLKELRRHVDERYPDRMLLAEANQWPEDAAAYFGDGDECHMAFHFPLMPRLFMAIRMEDRFPIVDILQQTPSIPDNAQWALFLRNHDELTLEMVTDEDRDYMYRTYGHDPRARINLGIRRRLAPLLNNDRRRIELMNALLLSLPGTPVVYYGDEIGMGDNIYLGDRNGVRTPMQWNGDRNAGFSRANPQRLYLPVIIDPEYHYEAINVETQQGNSQSLLWWIKRLIAQRKLSHALGEGSVEFLFPENRKVLAFLRRSDEERVLVLANLSRFSQYVELDLAAFAGMTPVEMFGRTPFPAIGTLPYLLTLGPFGFLWLSLRAPKQALSAAERPDEQLPVVAVVGDWQNVARGSDRRALEAALQAHLPTRPWFGRHGNRIVDANIVDVVPLTTSRGPVLLLLARVEYAGSEPEVYQLALGHATGDAVERIRTDLPEAVIARLTRTDGNPTDEGLLYDASLDPVFAVVLVDAIGRRRRYRGERGIVASHPSRDFARLAGAGPLPEPTVLRPSRANTSVVFGDRLYLKMLRRVEEGVDPDLELARVLAARGFEAAPKILGTVEYRRERGATATLALLEQYVQNEGDAWRYTIDTLERFFERVLAGRVGENGLPQPTGSLLAAAAGRLPDIVDEAVGSFRPAAQLLGERTAEMHLALGAGEEDPAFAPEPFTPFYQRSLYQAARTSTRQALIVLRRGLATLPAEDRESASLLLAAEVDLVDALKPILGDKITAGRLRCHGDYHLGQLLFTGKDFVIIDFQGDSERPLGERRIKRSPLTDLAGLLRSFHLASMVALHGGAVRPDDIAQLRPWVRSWRQWASAVVLKAYLERAGDAPWLPADIEELARLLSFYLTERAIEGLRQDLERHPERVGMDVHILLQVLEERGSTGA